MTMQLPAPAFLGDDRQHGRERQTQISALRGRQPVRNENSRISPST